MQTVKVDLADRSYKVYIGFSLLGNPHPVFDMCNSSIVLIVSNETVAPLYMDSLAASLTGARIHKLILPDGEAYKTAEHWSQIIDKLIDMADILDGLPFAQLAHVVRYKENAGRPKDPEHLRLLKASNHASD